MRLRFEGTAGQSFGAFLAPGLDVTLEGTSSRSDIRLVEVYWGGDARTLDYRSPDEVFVEGDRFGRSLRGGAESLTFRGRRELPSGQSCLWISVQLDPRADIDGRIDAGCTRLEFADGSELVPENAQPAGAHHDFAGDSAALGRGVLPEGASLVRQPSMLG